MKHASNGMEEAMAKHLYVAEMSTWTVQYAILALMYMLNPLQVLLHTQLECSDRGVRHLQFNMYLLIVMHQYGI